jgi:uncharacterized membrane protein YdbT with pleckstrin-like domain
MLVAVVLWFVIGEAAPTLRMTAFVLFAGFAVLTAIKEWLEQWITEIAVTDRRVIYKTGLIRRQTAEMNMDKIESVKVDQSLLGRLLNYGLYISAGPARDWSIWTTLAHRSRCEIR